MEKCGITPHRLYRDLLTLIEQDSYYHEDKKWKQDKHEKSINGRFHTL